MNHEPLNPKYFYFMNCVCRFMKQKNRRSKLGLKFEEQTKYDKWKKKFPFEIFLSEEISIFSLFPHFSAVSKN